MIHAFELGLLKEEDRQEFEQHLLKCQSCFEQVKDFLASAQFLRHDPDFKKDASEDIEEKIISKKKWFNFTRLLAAAALIVVIAIPIYWFGFLSTPDQEIVLLPSRISENNVLLLEEGGAAKISFAIEDFRQDAVYNLTIIDISGDTILYKPKFSSFNEQGLGSISIPVSELKVGHYILNIRPMTDSISVSDIQYMFRVK